jgi:hypothetical protein
VTVLSAVLALALVLHLAAHVAMVVALARLRMFARAAVSVVVPPLALYWTLVYGRRREPYAWLGTLALYVVARIAVA